jgi:hypothetical protein
MAFHIRKLIRFCNSDLCRKKGSQMRILGAPLLEYLSQTCAIVETLLSQELFSFQNASLREGLLSPARFFFQKRSSQTSSFT